VRDGVINEMRMKKSGRARRAERAAFLMLFLTPTPDTIYLYVFCVNPFPWICDTHHFGAVREAVPQEI